MQKLPNFVSIFVDKFYVQPFHTVYQHENESDAFNRYEDGTAVEDTTIYMYCSAVKPIITLLQPAKDGMSLDISAHLGNAEDVRSFKVPIHVLSRRVAIGARIVRAQVVEDDDINMSVFFSDGTAIQISTWYVCKTCGPDDFKHLTVFYVGKGDSDNYENGSLDRVVNGHKKLQKFQNRLKPGYIPILLLARLTFQYAFARKGQEVPLMVKDRAARGKWRTNVFEAALIYYFKPTFNELGKNNYPTEFIRNLAKSTNVELILNEIVTDDLDVILSSFHVPPSAGHIFGDIPFSKAYDIPKLITEFRRATPITPKEYLRLSRMEDIILNHDGGLTGILSLD